MLLFIRSLKSLLHSSLCRLIFATWQRYNWCKQTHSYFPEGLTFGSRWPDRSWSQICAWGPGHQRGDRKVHLQPQKARVPNGEDFPSEMEESYLWNTSKTNTNQRLFGHALACKNANRANFRCRFCAFCNQFMADRESFDCILFLSEMCKQTCDCCWERLRQLLTCLKNLLVATSWVLKSVIKTSTDIANLRKFPASSLRESVILGSCSSCSERPAWAV